MAEDSDIGMVTEVLPKGMVRVRLDDGRVIQAGLSTAAKHGMVRLLKGDRVRVKISLYDSQRAQITQKISS